MSYHRHNYRDDIAGPAWLYRLYTGSQLSYVGVSSDPWSRFAKHRRKPWWGDVDRAALLWFPSRAEAFSAERAIIVSEKPLHNIARPKGAAA